MRPLIKLVLILCIFIVGCNAPLVENIYRKKSRFNGGLNVPVACLASEWAGKLRSMGSAWLIDGGNGVLFSAKHVIDVFIGDIIELGGSECKVFMGGKVYDCVVVRVPPLRDAVVIKLKGFDIKSLPKPYKVAEEKVKIGEKLFIEGFHPHPIEITASNMKDGIKDSLIPILKDFYEFRSADPERQKEISFDSLEAKVVSVDEHIRVNDQEHDALGELKFNVNEYIKVITVRNHKFSFGGLSGGVAVRINSKGEKEAVAIVTAERPVRFEYDKKGQSIDKSVVKIAVFDTILLTPIHSVKELYEDKMILR